jgi:hypothetical protein
MKEEERKSTNKSKHKKALFFSFFVWKEMGNVTQID